MSEFENRKYNKAHNSKYNNINRKAPKSKVIKEMKSCSGDISPIWIKPTNHKSTPFSNPRKKSCAHGPAKGTLLCQWLIKKKEAIHLWTT